MEINELFNLMADKFREFDTRLKEVELRNVSADNLGEIAADLGSFYNGQLMAITAADPTEVGANGAFFDAEGVAFSDGQLYHVGGVNNGQLMFGLRAVDGAGIFAGGQGVIDRYGQHMAGIRYALEHVATDPDGNNPRRGAIEMFYPDGQTIPAYRIVFGDGSEATELVTNGDFESGTTGWTATLTGDSTFSTFVYQIDDNRAQLYRAPGQSGNVVSNSFAVEAGKPYRVRLLARGAAQDSVTISGQIDWYDAGATLITSSIILNANRVLTGGWADTGEQTINTSVIAPTGAVTGRVYLVVSAGGTLTIDNVSVQLLSINYGLVFDNFGFSVLKWTGNASSGREHNRLPSGSYTTQIMVMRVLLPMRIRSLNWDIRNTGNYEVKLLWTANAANSIKTLWSGSVGAAGYNLMTLLEPEVLLPGLYYIGLTRTSGATTWWDYNAATYVDGEEMIPAKSTPYYRLEGSYYNTTSVNYVPAVIISFNSGKWS